MSAASPSPSPSEPARVPRTTLWFLIPVGWFPGAVAYDAKRRSIAVANIKGIGLGGRNREDGTREYNSLRYTGSLSLVPVVLTRAEVHSILDSMTGAPWLVAGLLYGAGLRLLDGLRLRVQVRSSWGHSR